jgi:hypothetical protein
MAKVRMEDKVRMIGFDDAGIAEACRLGRLEHKTDAKGVSYDPSTDRMVITLYNGTSVAVPRRMFAIRGIKGTTVSKSTASKLRVSRFGTALEFRKLDMDFSVHGLLRKAVLGDDPYARAGRTKSPAKAAAARANGAKGGRPKAAA